jgi:hypothetical protein
MVKSDASPGVIKNAINAHFEKFGNYLIYSNKILIKRVTKNIE